MTSSRSSISVPHSGGFSVHSDISASAVPPPSRSRAQLTRPDGLESLQTVRQSIAGSGSGSGNTFRSAAQQYGAPSQPAGSVGHSGSWRQSMQSGGSGAGSNAASFVPQQYGAPSQPGGSLGRSGAWRESLQSGRKGSRSAESLRDLAESEQSFAARASAPEPRAGSSSAGFGSGDVPADSATSFESDEPRWATAPVSEEWNPTEEERRKNDKINKENEKRLNRRGGSSWLWGGWGGGGGGGGFNWGDAQIAGNLF